MKHFASNLLTVFCGTATLVALAACVQSYRVHDCFIRRYSHIDSFTYDSRETRIDSTRGRLSIRYGFSLGEPAGTTAWEYDPTPQGVQYSHAQHPPKRFVIDLAHLQNESRLGDELTADLHGLGFSFVFRDHPYVEDVGREGQVWGIWVGVPYAAIALLFGLLPIVKAYRWFNRKPPAATRPCFNCHYSLTGNTSGVCPECGHAIAATSPADPAKT